MSNPTTPFNWQMPTNTDLVTDLPADFEVFGQAVATSMADLLGGTTGQVLSKATNADMDFTWTSANPGDITGVTAGVGITGGGTSGTVTVTNDMATTITTAGDLIYGTGSGTYTRRGIGSNAQVLTVSGGVPTWATPSSGGTTFSGCSVYNSGNQSHSTGADLTPTFDTETFDTDAYHSTSSNTSRLTIPTGKTGYYLVSAIVAWASNPSAARAVQIIKNAASQIARAEVAATQSGANYVVVEGIFYLAAADYVTLQCYQNSGSTINVLGGAGNTIFSIAYLGA